MFVVPDPPTNIRLVSITQTSIEISFDEAKGSYGYNVTASPEDITVNTETNTALLTGRSAGTRYTITVVSLGLSSFGSIASASSSPFNVTTGKNCLNNLFHNYFISSMSKC